MKWIQDPRTGKLYTEMQWRQEGFNAVVGKVTVVPDIGDIQNPQGKWLHGRKQLREDLKRQNCHIYERGEREYIEKMRAQHERDGQRALNRALGEIAAERGLGVPD